MIQCILDNGKMAKDMEEENNYGKMGAFMKDIGKIIWQMDLVV